MAERFSCERRVEFCETDAAGIAHFSSLMCYMEQVEHSFLRHLGYSVQHPLDDGWHMSWPRVRIECDFQNPASFEQVLTGSIGLLRLGNKSMTYGIELTRDQLPIIRGKVTVVCCRVRVGHALESMPIPLFIKEKLQAYLVDQ